MLPALCLDVDDLQAKPIFINQTVDTFIRCALSYLRSFFL